MLNSPRSLYLPAAILGALVAFLAWALALGTWFFIALLAFTAAIVWMITPPGKDTP